VARPVVQRLRRLAVAAAGAVGLESRNRRRKVERRLTKTVRVVSHVDPALIGGLVVRVGDRIADKSVRTLLTQMRDELLAARIPS